MLDFDTFRLFHASWSNTPWTFSILLDSIHFCALSKLSPKSESVADPISEPTVIMSDVEDEYVDEEEQEEEDEQEESQVL